ncbi:MAG: DUF2284 domain-containing protein, partial [Desulfomonilia bacterium]|nr:DUF2284 domain-containing protein [Desulfomonilia bacterium]
MRDELEVEIEKLTRLAEERNARATPVSPADVVVSQWVRFKCRFGCKGYGKHLSCPPYAPTVEETRKMVSEYDT